MPVKTTTSTLHCTLAMQEIVQSARLETYLRSNRRSQSYANRAYKSRHARLDCGNLMAGIESTRPNSMMDLDAKNM